ncbi:MAG: rhomboid family intramembrane serine protease, partial [Nannocystaceae bacterium]
MDTSRAQISESREPYLRESRATVLLLVVCALYFVVELVVVGRTATDPSDALLDSYWILDATILTSIGALDVTRVWLDHEWWRLFTTSLMHGSWIHLILNLTALASIGPWVEKVWGWRAMLVGFWASAVLGALASCAWVEARFVVGASGGILGLAVILWAARVWGNREVRASLEDILASRLGWMLVAILALGFLVPAIAQAGHIGGFVAGA